MFALMGSLNSNTALRILRWLVKAVVSLGLLVVLIANIDRERVAGVLKAIEPSWLALALVFQGTAIFAGILRWRLLLHGQGLGLSISAAAQAYLVGRFFGSFTPSTVGLDAYRTYYAAVRTREVARCLAVTLVEKVIGLFALSCLSLACLPFGARFLPTAALQTLGIGLSVPIAIAFALLVRPRVFVLLGARLDRRRGKLRQALARFSEAVGRFGQARGRVAWAVLLGLCVHAATVGLYVATARAVRVQVPATEILFVAPLMIAATLLPISIAGLGVREATFVFFLGRVGVGVEPAVLLGFLGYLVGELYSLIGGALWLLRPAARPGEDEGLQEVLARVRQWFRQANTNTDLVHPRMVAERDDPRT